MSVNTKGDECDSQAVESGTRCEGSECLRILQQLRELHEDNLRRIDDELGRDGTEVKLKAMQLWISDLEEQHALFLQTMVQLEQEAGDRVLLLQEGLHRSSQAAVAYRTRLDDYDKDDFLEKRVSSARNEELQQLQIQKLQSDITNLLELIRRVREENSWDASGLTFNEVTYEDIFGTEDMFSGHTVGTVQDSQTSTAVSFSWEMVHSTPQNQGEVSAYPNDEILRLRHDLEKCKDDKGREVSELEMKIERLKFDIEWKEKQIQSCVRNIQAFRNNVCSELNEGSIEHQLRCGNVVDTIPEEFLKCSLEDFCECLQRAVEDKEKLAVEVKSLKTELQKSKAQAVELRMAASDLKQSNKDIRESLTAEVAERHDQILALHHVINDLEDNCHEAEMKVRLKDDVIKQMRKDREDSGSKNVFHSTDYKSEVNNSQQEEQSLCPDEPLHSSTPINSDTSEQLSAGETYSKVWPCNSPPAGGQQLSADDIDMSGHEIDTVNLENVASEEKNNVDTAEHLKNLLLISDNKIKKQKENINGLQDTVKKYENDLNDLQIKAEQMELALKDSKLKYIQQITDQDAMINDLRKIVKTSHTEVEMLKERCEKYERSAEAVQEERENLKTEMEKLQYNLISREKVAANQEEIINILQDSVNIAQKEQQDLQQKLKDAEAGKEKLQNTLQEERKKTETLQEALMITKRQLEDLQGNKYEVSVNSGMSWGWSHTSRNGHVNKRTVHDV